MTASRPRDPLKRKDFQPLREPRFEVIPLPGIEDEIDRYLPADSTVTVTASPRRGLAPTVELATRLATRGIHTVPHLAARYISDQAELRGIVHDLDAAGVREVFVVGGDLREPVGEFRSALQLLRAMQSIGHELTVGIAGYPETHPLISDDAIVRALRDKQDYASYIVSQMSFDARVVREWVDQLRHRGINLPVRIGIAGPVGTARLLRVGARVGVGDSLRVLRKHRGMIQHVSGSWTPGRLLDDLAPAFADPSYGLVGLHIYTFNALAQTAQWWYEEGGRRPGHVVEGGPADLTSEE
ncbi:methylenetetrahydrofolate reductase [Paramicrobacterium chengjingii]|uniref:Methylenetetrahydrofolate reductase n=1 Tax=Paramicrobacterium chengjingii TaxID=2769067 RepID=A0ABX6YK92_9MICO|nr:methylenetetrahydrofolate reductase [Microbacterium chengjingii]QPZ38762.1 methylenetetrahydrofolate reductase [Microbacterium chengjingii]